MQGAFEGKKHAVRQTQDGWVVSFVVHPNDMAPDFATAPLGTRYMVGFAQIGDDEQPVPIPAPLEPASAPSVRSEQGKARYAAASDMEKALIRAATLPKDERFQQWVAGKRWHGHAGDRASEHTAVAHIRENCCQGASRKRISEDSECYDAFVKMETAYLIESGILPEPR